MLTSRNYISVAQWQCVVKNSLQVSLKLDNWFRRSCG